MPVWLMGLCFGVATWPFWLALSSPTLLYMRPFLHLIIGPSLCSIALGCWAGGMICIDRLSTRCHVRDRRQAVLRLAITFGASIAFIALHASAIPFNLLFAMHRPWFEAERVKALSTLAADQTVPHARIGLFNVVRVRRSHDDEIGFEIDGSSVYFDPTPATPDCVFYPPGDGGSLIGGWKWEATD